MSHKCTIAGNPVELSWSNETQKRMHFRASAVGINLGTIHKDFTKPNKAAAAYSSFLWCILPAKFLADYPTPEELYVAIEDNEAPAIHAALFGIFEDMAPDVEKKSTSRNSHLPKSNSGSRKKNSTSSTRT